MMEKFTSCRSRERLNHEGPELSLSVSDNIVRIDIRKGKNPMFAECLQVNDKDSKKLIKYLEENFAH